MEILLSSDLYNENEDAVSDESGYSEDPRSENPGAVMEQMDDGPSTADFSDCVERYSSKEDIKSITSETSHVSNDPNEGGNEPFTSTDSMVGVFFQRFTRRLPSV